jgi:hypothetical protein
MVKQKKHKFKYEFTMEEGDTFRFHGGRIYVANPNHPPKVWMPKERKFEDFTEPKGRKTK